MQSSFLSARLFGEDVRLLPPAEEVHSSLSAGKAAWCLGYRSTLKQGKVVASWVTVQQSTLG